MPSTFPNKHLVPQVPRRQRCRDWLDERDTYLYLSIILPALAAWQTFWPFMSDDLFDRILLVYLLYLSLWAVHVSWQAKQEARKAQK